MKHGSLLVALSTIWLMQAQTAWAGDRLTPGQFRIRSLNYGGSGCPAGTVAENISPDLQAFTLIFDSYIAEVGPGVALSAKRKNCQLTFDFDYPNGWSFALLSLDSRGYMALDQGVSGTQQVRFYFQGNALTATLNTVFQGPADRDYQIRDTVPTSSLVFSPCGPQRALNVNTSINLSNTFNRNGFGLLTQDSIDGHISQIYSIIWRRCSN